MFLTTRKILNLITKKYSTAQNPILQDSFGRNHNYLRISLTERCNLRFTSNLSHIDSTTGKAKMVNIADKSTTYRSATASASIKIGKEVAKLIQSNTVKKGDVLSISQISGILGAKRTHELIPLCHNIPLDSVNVNANLIDDEVVIQATVNSTGKTGVEMEALTAVSVAALTVYDMCKSVNKKIIIKDIKLLRKSGGKSGDYNIDEIEVREFDRSPLIKPTAVIVGSV